MSSFALIGSSRGRRLLPALAVAVILAGCAAAHPATIIRSADSPLVNFPADQANHPGARNEWWYIVGHVKSGSRTFGYETTIFKFDRVRPPGFPVPLTIYRTDVAITDEAAHRFHQRVTYYFPQSAALSVKALNVRVGNVWLRGSSPHSMDLNAALPAGRIAMHLSTRRGPMYVGGRGYIPFGDGYTYYYSLTDLAAGGTLQLGAQRFTVTGVSWLDHQWGRWSWSTIRGWIWMALQLNNDVQLSIFDFRGTHTRVRAASVMPARGGVRTVRSLTIASTGSWRSPHTGGLYPSGWVIRLPALKGILHVAPTMRDQELTVPNQPRGSYWEGSGHVSGTWNGKRVHGLSYTELTGYATRARSRQLSGRRQSGRPTA